MTSPKISVIVPIYKVETYLMQCIQSIVDQTLKDIEIILVDEGDADACYAIMLYFASRDKRVKIIHEKCGGYGAACNKGINAATGEFISIIESDDFIDPTMFEELYNRAVELGVDVIKSPFWYFYDTHQVSSPYRHLCDYAEFITSSSPAGVFNIVDYPQQMSVHASVWSGIYRTEFMKKNGIYFIDRKPGAYVDVEFRLRAFVETDKIAWYDKPFYNWRCTNVNSSTNSYNISTMIRRWSETHDYYDGLPNHVCEKLIPYHIIDEYLNTWAIFFIDMFKKTEDDFVNAKANLDRIRPEFYLNSPVLTAEHKNKITIFREAKAMGDLVWPHPDLPMQAESVVASDGPLHPASAHAANVRPVRQDNWFKKALAFSPVRIRLRGDLSTIRFFPWLKVPIVLVLIRLARAHTLRLSVGAEN